MRGWPRDEGWGAEDDDEAGDGFQAARGRRRPASLSHNSRPTPAPPPSRPAPAVFAHCTRSSSRGALSAHCTRTSRERRRPRPPAFGLFRTSHANKFRAHSSYTHKSSPVHTQSTRTHLAEPLVQKVRQRQQPQRVPRRRGVEDDAVKVRIGVRLEELHDLFLNFEF